MAELAAARAALYSMIETIDPDIDRIRDIALADRLPWRKEIEDGELSTPFATVEFGRSTNVSHEYALSSRAWLVDATVYYILGEVKSNGQRRTIEEVLSAVESFCESLAGAIKDEGAAFQCMDFPDIDTSSEMEANDYFLETNMPYFAGAVRARLLVGTIAP